MTKPKILITGGSGYIGSIIAHQLRLEAHYDVAILDRRASENKVGEFKASIDDAQVLDLIHAAFPFEFIVHCAGSIEVAESVRYPLKYYQNNVAATVRFLEQALSYNTVRGIVFSSSAAVYGNQTETPIKETATLNPTSPYGRTKLIVEQILQDVATAHGVPYIALRYFNAAGACNGHGEKHEPETHVIPNLLQSILYDLPFNIFGTDFPTPDGTAIRDFIHVQDLAQAHIKAINYLQEKQASLICNVGSGNGSSIKEIVETAVEIVGKPVNLAYHPRRAGDPAILVADTILAQDRFDWSPQHSTIKQIVSDAWQFHQFHGPLLNNNFVYLR